MLDRKSLACLAGILTLGFVTAIASAQSAAAPGAPATAVPGATTTKPSSAGLEALWPIKDGAEIPGVGIVRSGGVTLVQPLQKGDRLAIVGDSITEQRIYTRFMEDYLTACTPELDLWIVQLGWSGEKAGEFLDRMDVDLLSLKPTIFTTCYGMNDGLYRAFDQSIGDLYMQNTFLMVLRGNAAGARVVVGSPGAVDTQYFKGGGRMTPITPAVYNDNLNHLKKIAWGVAGGQFQGFADVHDAMIQAMGPAKAKLGNEYPVCGRDGFHPGPNGHLVMAYAFLKALGQNGDIGTITVDAANSKAEATTGHKVLSFQNGVTEIESTRYPFCFIDDEKSGMSSRSILPFVPFNQDLNRFMLVVTGLKADSAKVTWGTATKTFTRDQLAKGVNLAAEFAEGNPFTTAFAVVDAAVALKQGFETTMIKNTYHSLASIQSGTGDNAQTAALKSRLVAAQEALRQSVKAAVVPVKHTIRIEEGSRD